MCNLFNCFVQTVFNVVGLTVSLLYLNQCIDMSGTQLNQAVQWEEIDLVYLHFLVEILSSLRHLSIFTYAYNIKPHQILVLPTLSYHYIIIRNSLFRFVLEMIISISEKWQELSIRTYITPIHITIYIQDNQMYIIIVYLRCFEIICTINYSIPNKGHIRTNVYKSLRRFAPCLPRRLYHYLPCCVYFKQTASQVTDTLRILILSLFINWHCSKNRF